MLLIRNEIMLLRIVDISEQQETKNYVEVIFLSDDNDVITYKSEYFPSFYTKNFSNLKDWYFEKYQLDPSKNDQNFVYKYINLGQNMGDQFLGDDSEIYKIIKVIEENQYQNLFVTVESTNPTFFKEQWEAIVLPDSKYTLSSTVKGFFRTYQQQNSTSILNKIEVDETKNIVNDSKLKVLNIFVEISEFKQDHESYAYDIFIDSLCYNNLIDYESLYFESAEKFKKSIKNISFIPDIIIFNGGIACEDFQNNFKEMHVTTTDIIELIKFTNPIFFTINSFFYSPQDGILDRELNLAKLAKYIIEETDKTVLGFSNSTPFWVYSDCIKLIIEKIASGLSLGQSVVEARKSIQKKQEYNEISITPIPFQPWGILQLYGINNSRLVQTPRVKVDINDSDQFKTIKSKLHGFNSEQFPPNSVAIIDHYFPRAITNLQQYKNLLIIAPQGYGKSHLAHKIAIFMIYKGFDKGFRFDFSRHAYTSSTMLEMIAPMVGQLADESNKTYEALVGLKSLFVFENIDSINMQSNIESISNFIENLKGDNNSFIFTTCKDEPLSFNPHIHKLYLSILPAISKRILGARTFQSLLQEKILENADEIYSEFTSITSIPFLLKKIPPLLINSTFSHLKDELYKEFGAHGLDNCKDIFYSWGFSKLNEVTRNLFLTLKNIKGIYLEILNSTLSSGQGFQPAAQFLELLGNPEADYSKCLDELEAFDFITRHPYGRTINEESLVFLDASEILTNNALTQKISTLTSVILCESVRRVIAHLSKNQNQIISFNFLTNRGLFATHMEALWHAQEYHQFDKTLISMDSFLKQNGIHEEIPEWSYHLLKYKINKELDLKGDSEFSIVYLKLVIYALTDKNFTDKAVFQKIVKQCYDWLVSKEYIEHVDFLQLNLYCLKILEKYYLLEKSYKSLIEISEIMLDIFVSNKMDQFSISTLKMIIYCFTELKDFSQCEKHESLLLESLLQNEDMPEFVRQQVQMSLVSGRVLRGDSDLASSLLDKIEEAYKENKNMENPINLLKGDIAYLKNNLKEACQIYSITLSRLYSQHQDIKQFEFIIEKLRKIQMELGESEFNKILNDQNIPFLIDLIDPSSK
jgi:hypothetical protein